MGLGSGSPDSMGFLYVKAGRERVRWRHPGCERPPRPGAGLTSLYGLVVPSLPGHNETLPFVAVWERSVGVERLRLSARGFYPTLHVRASRPCIRRQRAWSFLPLIPLRNRRPVALVASGRVSVVMADQGTLGAWQRA